MTINARFNHRFTVKAPLSSVVNFHQKPGSMADITPPPIRVKFQQTPKILADGSEMAFTLWLGPLPVRWQACIENLSAAGFTDRQLKGPFKQWVHVHSFERVDETTTAVIDQIAWQLQPHLIWGLVGLGFYFGLPVLFRYRAWKTRRLLERRSE